MRSSILGIILFLVATAATAKPTHPWLVTVSSTYTDEVEPHQTHTIQGSGFVINAYGQQWIVTAAHLSQGDISPKRRAGKVTVTGYDERTGEIGPISVITRYAVNQWDVEVMLVEPGRHALVALAEHKPTDAFPNGAEAHPFGWLVATDEAKAAWRSGVIFNEPDYFPISLSAFAPLPPSLRGKIRSPLTGTSTDDMLALAEKSAELRQRIRLGFDMNEIELTTAIPFAPGMSGSPLIFRVNDAGDTVVLGVISARSPVFHRGWAVPDLYVTRVLEVFATMLNDKFENGKVFRGWYLADKVYWSMRSGQLYRWGAFPDAAMAYREIIFDQDQPIRATPRTPTGGSRADTGGSRADTGGSRADTGGSRADTGDGQSPLFDGQADFYRSLGLRPGVLWQQGQTKPVETMAFALSLENKTFVVPADESGTHAVIQHYFLGVHGKAPKATITPIAVNDNIVPHLVASLTRRLGPPLGDAWQRTAHAAQVYPVDSATTFAAPLSIRISRNEDTGVPIALHVRIDLGSDVIAFSVKATSEPLTGPGELRFQPIVQVKGQTSGHGYLLALSGLLADDTSGTSFYAQRSATRFELNEGERELSLTVESSNEPKGEQP